MRICWVTFGKAFYTFMVLSFITCFVCWYFQFTLQHKESVSCSSCLVPGSAQLQQISPGNHKSCLINRVDGSWTKLREKSKEELPFLSVFCGLFDTFCSSASSWVSILPHTFNLHVNSRASSFALDLRIWWLCWLKITEFYITQTELGVCHTNKTWH